ncbi:hypothetical protein IJI31_07595 [bacterium]|nr:hypothetical protein [bacterium]
MSINAVTNNLSGIGIQPSGLTSLYANMNSIGSIESHTFSEYLNKSIEAINNQNTDKSPINVNMTGMPAQLQYELFNNELSELADKFENLINTTDNKVENNQDMSAGKDLSEAAEDKTTTYDIKDLNKDGEVSASETLRFFANNAANFIQNQSNSGLFQNDTIKNFMQQQGLKIYDKIMPVAQTALNLV